jgi:hypothetical protein
MKLTRCLLEIRRSCSDLVNPDGTLSAAGVTAKARIANGVGLALGGLGLGLPYDTVISGLNALAGMTGCGNQQNSSQTYCYN